MTPEDADAVLTDSSTAIRWAGLLFAVCALALIPWTFYLAATLPSRQVSPHVDIAWTGFDVMLFLALATTAVTALRRSRFLVMAATWSAALLTVDAWFDVVTSPAGNEQLEAVLSAALIELPLAAVCVWLATHSQAVATRRVKLLLSRPRHAELTGTERAPER